MYAATGAAIGKAKAKERQQEEKEKRALIEEEKAFQAQKRQAARDWEIEKMRMESEQQEAHRLRMQQAQLEKEARAEEWAVEKMEIASRIDFEREEMERQRDLSELSSKIKSINDGIASGKYSENDTEAQRRLAWLTANKEAKEAGMPPVSYSAISSAIGTSGEQERAEGRYRMAQESATRSAAREIREQEVHEGRELLTPEAKSIAARRKRAIDIMGSGYREVPLNEAEAEMRELGLIPPPSFDTLQPVTPDEVIQDANIPYPTPTSQEAYDAIPSGSRYIDSAGKMRTKS
jgi:hypothetical protein